MRNRLEALSTGLYNQENSPVPAPVPPTLIIVLTC